MTGGARPGRPALPEAATDVHHIRHQSDGGLASARNCAVFCEFHHETCIHRWGWEITLHPESTTEASSPDRTRVLRSHPPPGTRAAWVQPPKRT